MSKFEDNPFSDPAIDNPFADPSVQQVARSTNNATQGLDDYNPFDGQQNANQATPSQPTQPAIMQAVSPPIGGQYTRSNQPQQSQNPPQNFTTADFQKRQEELERKAEELARREAELRAGSAGRRNNWPPLPAFCPIQPCFYQDINVDIPLEFQRIVRHLYHLWMFHALVLALNIIGGLSLLFAGQGFTVFGLSILYFVLLTPFSFICWYRPIYKAFRSDSSFNFMVFFFIFLFQIIITLVQSIGFSGGGSCGLITSIAVFRENIGVGIVTLIVTIGFITAVVADVMLITKVHRIYRSTGASLAKAQAEFTTEILRNQHVQTAASSAAAAAVNAQIASANRY
ncbi:secretory carrier-associated membrane protein 1 isoform X1 [Vanessa tameamea]|uniref:Secretory carrier-associated membrane protein n=1 Tax=Vanessa tameamea TaxID=334116 RepID=A0ABM4AP29_VANTA|nr:secretory carrier-associated membrane protein 1 isoform X1 [Vanessa tameamea]XP_047532274.1 secretory carrier-associated membrane protein 1 isoform X2 [Vanessa atalanta]